MGSKLLNIKNLGQKIWLDNLSRELLKSDKLTSLISDDGIAGITSNPTIFYKAISNDIYYQTDLTQIKKTQLTLEERYEKLVIPDIQKACDLLLPMYQNSNHVDGYVSFEVSPYLANNSEETINNAKRLWQIINRPNLMIKIPATVNGIKAFEKLTAEGINVNITLLFSLSQVINTWQAYINGLNQRHQLGKPIKNIKAVASFFLSRIDFAIDDKLPKHLQGKTAINLCKKAYSVYQEVFNSDIFNYLKIDGAVPQFLLFASTGTKNKDYSDTLYVEELIGQDTINTVPDGTLDAFRDHGVANENLTKDIDLAPQIIDEIGQIINLQELGEQLQQDGLKLFTKSFDDLISLMK